MRIAEAVDRLNGLFDSIFKKDCPDILNKIVSTYRHMKSKKRFSSTSSASQRVMNILVRDHSLEERLEHVDHFYRQQVNQARDMHHAISLELGLYLLQLLNFESEEDKTVFTSLLREVPIFYCRQPRDPRKFFQSLESIDLVRNIELFLRQNNHPVQEYRTLRSSIQEYLSNPQNHFKRLWINVVKKLVRVRPICYFSEEEAKQKFVRLLQRNIEDRLIGKLLGVGGNSINFFGKTFGPGILNREQKKKLVRNFFLQDDLIMIRGEHNLYAYVEEGKNLKNLGDLTVDNWRDVLAQDYGWGRIQNHIQAMTHFLAEHYRDSFSFIPSRHLALLAEVAAHRVVRFFYNNDLTAELDLIRRMCRAVCEAEWKGHDENPIEFYGRKLMAAAFFINYAPSSHLIQPVAPAVNRICR